MTDAVAFLRNAHRTSEEHALKATPGPWEPEGDDPTDDQVMTVHDGEHGDWVGGTVAFVRSGAWGQPGEGRTYANMCLIADHAAPDAVLRRIAAERELLGEHAGTWASGMPDEAHWTHDPIPPSMCSTCNSDGYPCQTVLLLAAGWGWTKEDQPAASLP